jgi:catechol 2,3-dioxygenase-like lactoylglutathione lyase family enzyme
VLKNFDHPTVIVADLDAAVSAHERLLGFAPRFRSAAPELGTSSALFGFSNALLELTAPHAAAPEAEGLRSWLAARGEGLQSICFGSTDAAACSAELRARGVPATAPQAGTSRCDDGSARSYRIVELSPRSTRGVAVAIVERPSPLFGPETAAVAGDAVHALDHVVVRSADPEAAIALYGRGLGIRLALDRRFGETRMLFFRIGGVTLEIVEDRSLGADDALHGLAFRVRDIDAANARLRAAGVDASEVRPGNKPGTRVFSVRAGTCNVPTLFLSDPARG